MPDSKDDNSTKRAPEKQGAPESSTPTEPATVAIPKASPKPPAPEPATVAIPKAQQPQMPPPQAPQRQSPQPKAPQPVRAAPQRVGVAAGIPPQQPLPTRIEPPRRSRRSAAARGGTSPREQPLSPSWPRSASHCMSRPRAAAGKTHRKLRSKRRSARTSTLSRPVTLPLCAPQRVVLSPTTTSPSRTTLLPRSTRMR